MRAFGFETAEGSNGERREGIGGKDYGTESGPDLSIVDRVVAGSLLENRRVEQIECRARPEPGSPSRRATLLELRDDIQLTPWILVPLVNETAVAGV